MKKILLLSFAFSISFFHFGQLFSDNFDSYTVGSYLGPQSLTWSTWSGTEGGAEDATITAAQSSSNPHSIYFSSTLNEVIAVTPAFFMETDGVTF